ncbi:hypothetical protein CAMRE0001_1693 [Campylobacter rectus RM3267]|uniref:Uncharacterized protein n=1 Tax=Campylobacter rectus RM3267 TaxID=553218 RepID=B9CZA8_CAMRE|nr:hypothetical protein CAMRE0001_1693 [Campylobacter rectus RM3267]
MLLKIIRIKFGVNLPPVKARLSKSLCKNRSIKPVKFK